MRKYMNLILLGVAIMLAFVSTALILKTVKAHAGGGVAAGRTTPVVVAAKSVPSGTQITTQDVTTQQVAGADVQPGALASPKQVVGQYALSNWIQGQQIVSGMAGTPQAVEFALSIPNGERAYTVPDSALAGVDHLIAPGEHVDIMAIEKVGSVGSVKTVMQDMLVLYVDQEQNAARPTGNTTSGSTANSSGDSITLAVTPKEAEELQYVLSFNGQLAMTLRHPNDSSVQTVPPQTQMP